MAQTVAGRGGSNGGAALSLGVRGRAHRQLAPILSRVLAERPPVPAWPENMWRSALLYRDAGGAPQAATVERGQVRAAILAVPSVRPLVRWATHCRPAGYELAATAAALAVVGQAVNAGERDAAALADRVMSAVHRARWLQYVPPSDAALLADCDQVADTEEPSPSTDSSTMWNVLHHLLDLAGFDTRLDPLLSRRIEVTVDVALRQWLVAERQPEACLPEFVPASRQQRKDRLAYRLGGDRALQRLVEGPQPGRGRPLQEARRRGCGYWVAASLYARTEGRPLPSSLPAKVVAHWQRELSCLGASVRSLDSLPSPLIERHDQQGLAVG